MTIVLKKCAATHCQAQVPRHLLMCIDHWRMVPAPVQREVSAGWRAVRLAEGSQAQLDALKVYRKSVESAVAAVATKEEAKQARRAESAGELFPCSNPNKNPTHGDNTQQGQWPQE
jgi:hypothetical protein